ncbi:MAG: shikimate kinase, partial [Verrucomicrobiota bacterium]
LKSKGVVVCLYASIETIIERTRRNKNRPLLNVDDPEARIRELLAEREPIYMDSGVCISTDGRSIQEVTQHLERTYRNCARDFGPAEA